MPQSFPNHRPLAWLSVILVLGFALRLSWALWIPVEPVSDSWLYREFARSIAAGKGFAYPDGGLTAYWPVGTPAVYALMYSIFGDHDGVIAALNVVLGVALIWLTYRLARYWLGDQVALGAAALVACWPLLVQFTTILASELLFTFLCMAALALHTLRAPSFGRNLGTGLLLAFACLVRPTAIVFFVLMAVFEWAKTDRVEWALKSLLTFAIAAAAVIGPWTARNHLLFGSPVLVSTNFGPNLWMGNNPDSSGGYMELPTHLRFANEVDRARYFKQAAIDHILADPLAYLRMSVKRFVETHNRETIGVGWNEPSLNTRMSTRAIWLLKLVSSAYWWLCAALAMVGAILLRGRLKRACVHPLVVIPLFTVAVPTLTVAQDRYHFPLIPFVAMLAVHGALAIVGSCVTRRSDAPVLDRVSQ